MRRRYFMVVPPSGVGRRSDVSGSLWGKSAQASLLEKFTPSQARSLLHSPNNNAPRRVDQSG